MAVKMSQSLRQTQSLMMTPQLQQAIKLLTLTHLEMTTMISKELVENPLLEERTTDSSAEETKDVEYNLEKLENQNKEADSDTFSGPEIVQGGKESFDWEGYVEAFNSHASSPGKSMVSHDPDEVPNYENIVFQEKTLPEHLEWQLRTEELSEHQLNFAQIVLHNIDEQGYLEVDFDQLVKDTEMDVDSAEEVLFKIQNLDPIGCGARNLKECLLIQARALVPRVYFIEDVIEQHLEDLHQHDYDKITKELGICRDQVKDAEFIILNLNPKPGVLINATAPQYVIPDIFVKEVSGKFEVDLNDEGVPSLKISGLYRSLLTKREGTEEEKEYVKDKLRAAMWLIKSIQNRKKTIYKVSEAIVATQQDFFRKGAMALKPMILKDIANEIGMHESTVSRVTTNKYMHTPIGVYELKYFFNTGIGGKKGGIDIASESLKLKIKELIKSENLKRPLSDQKISDLLSRDDIKVARRTVAKYREIMNILPSSKRKKK